MNEDHEWLPLDAVRDAFQRLVTGPNPMTLDGARFPGLPQRPVALDELRDLLMSKQCPRRTRDDVWAHLVLRSRAHGERWTLACAGMALPSLASSARWLAARCRGDRADIHAAVLAGFLEALAVLDLAEPAIALRLHFAARRAGHAALEESLDTPPPVGARYRSLVPQPPSGHPELVLARAVGERILTPIEADLISATRLGDTSVSEWAQAHGTALKTAFKVRDRAEDRLAPWLLEQVSEPDSDDPVADAALTAMTAEPVDPPVDDEPGSSLAVSGRRRNGRPAGSKKPSRSASKNDPKSGLLGYGETSSGSPRPDDTPPNSEVHRCA